MSLVNQAVLATLESYETNNHFPNDVRVSNPDIGWKEFAGMRDKLIHEYFGVDINLVWEVVQRELPILEKQIRNI